MPNSYFLGAYRLLKKEEYLSAAMRVPKRYVIDHFYSRSFGGIITGRL